MPLSDYLKATGKRVHGGESGWVYRNQGGIWVGNAPKTGWDENLFAVAKIMVDELKLSIRITSVDTGEHSEHSRHYWGGAMDIGMTKGAGVESWKSCTATNPNAKRMVAYLLANGFQIGEGAPHAGLLLGPVHTKWNPTGINHATHAHVSIFR